VGRSGGSARRVGSRPRARFEKQREAAVGIATAFPWVASGLSFKETETEPTYSVGVGERLLHPGSNHAHHQGVDVAMNMIVVTA
jgi:hypothetical protein